MDRSLGERLRHQREQQGVALIAIADQTKIKLSLLEALGRDDVSPWLCRGAADQVA
jgi:cytoskeletal protein RodZ